MMATISMVTFSYIRHRLRHERESHSHLHAQRLYVIVALVHNTLIHTHKHISVFGTTCLLTQDITKVLW
jgi:hypothetical protein